MVKLYITHLTINTCHSYIVENTKKALDEWYIKHCGVSSPAGFWKDICDICKTKCSRSDDINNVSVSYITF